jgi:glycosyltransferase involved in cell wall biosynthesis
VGDPSPRKNIELLVGIWDEVVAQVPQAVLVLAGPPAWAASSWGAAFDRLVAAGHVVSLGRISDARLRWCYERTAVVLCPSRLEGFGLPAVEALAHGAPVITSTDPALQEASGTSGLAVPVDRPDLWTEAVVRALRASRSAARSPAVRTWDEVADDTVAAARRRLSA